MLLFTKQERSFVLEPSISNFGLILPVLTLNFGILSAFFSFLSGNNYHAGLSEDWILRNTHFWPGQQFWWKDFRKNLTKSSEFGWFFERNCDFLCENWISNAYFHLGSKEIPSQLIKIIDRDEISGMNINQSDLNDEKECSRPKIWKIRENYQI